MLTATALLLTGHGMQLTLLPMRAEALGVSASAIGLSASLYFVGFVVGCLLVPRLMGRIGHIRTFAVFTAVMLCSILALELTTYWPAWLLLRFFTGLGVCSLYAVIESWLNSHSDASNRGKILSIYTFVVLTAMTAGQFLINVGPVTSSVPFSVAALCLALAILPVGLTRRPEPQAVEYTKTSFTLLYQRSRSAFAGALLSGLVVGSFWSLGAVFAQRYMDSQMGVTVFMSLAIAGGALVQYPIGWLSDRVDRRRILLALTLGTLLASVAVATGALRPWFLPAVGLFGAFAMPLYAMSLATAADVCEGHEFVAIGSTVLLLNALGAVSAPILLGPLMSYFNATALFWGFAATCVVFSVYFVVQMRAPRAVTLAQQTPFEVAATEAAPVGFELDPRTYQPAHEPIDEKSGEGESVNPAPPTPPKVAE
ncbi:MAG: MFS transporter [Halioglobus sp.]